MTTTSLEMSRKLDAAGFFEKYNAGKWRWFTSPDGSSSHRRATLDDLVTALGLDKPWVKRRDCVSLLTRFCDDGLTHDVLAQVWLDTQGASHD